MAVGGFPQINSGSETNLLMVVVVEVGIRFAGLQVPVGSINIRMGPVVFEGITHNYKINLCTRQRVGCLIIVRMNCDI